MKWAALSLASVNVCSCKWHSFKALCISVAHLKRSCHLFPAVIIPQNPAEIVNSRKAVISLSRNWGFNIIEKKQEKGQERFDFFNRELQSLSSLLLYVLSMYILQYAFSARNPCILTAQQNRSNNSIKPFYCTFTDLKDVPWTSLFFPHQVWELKWLPSKPVFPFFLAHSRGL